MISPTRRARWIAAAALAAPILLFSARWFLSSGFLYGIDFEKYHWPHFEIARAAFEREGELPRWNPYQYAGTPFQGNPQSNLTYPPYWLFLVMPAERAFGWTVLLHLLAAAGGTYRLARGLRLPRGAAVLAGLSFALSFPLVARVWAGHLPYLLTPCLAPAFLHLLLRTLRRPDPLHAAALAGGTALLLLGGTPQYLYHLALLAAAAGAWACRRKPWVRPAVVALASGALGVLVAALHLLPAAEVAAETSRGAASSYYSSYEMLGWHHLSIRDLLSFAIPSYPWTGALSAAQEGDYWHERALYFGLLPLALSVLAVARGPRRGAVLFLAVAASVAILAGLPAVHTILSAILPGYASYRIPARSSWIAILCLALLAGFGWKAWQQRTTTPRLWLGAPAAVGVLVALILGIGKGAWPEALLVLLLSAGVTGVLAAGTRWASIAAVALLTWDLSFYGMSRLKTVDRDTYASAPWYAAHLGADRTRYRILDFTDFSCKPLPHGFSLLRGAGYPLPSRLKDHYSGAWDRYKDSPETLFAGGRLKNLDALRALSVRWIILDRAPHPEWRELARKGSSVLYEDPAATPLVSFPAGEASVAWRRPGMNRIEAEVQAPKAGPLVVSESWMPGWRATVNGQPAPVSLAFDTVLRIDLPAGPSKVTLEYDPAAWRTGRALTVAGLILLAGLVAWGVLRRGR